PAMVAGGRLMVLNQLLTSPLIHCKAVIALFPQSQGLATAINTFANAPFVFLPVLIGFSATKKFGGNPFLGAAMGMIMVHPDLLNAYQIGIADPPMWNIFGFQIAAIGYQGTVLPVLAVSWILANIEKRLRRVTPSWLDNLTTPLLSILVTSFLTFIFVGPVLREAGNLLAAGITWLYNTLGPVGGALFGFAYAPITMTGMHHSFIAIETQLLADSVHTGGSFIFSTASMNNVAQGAAVLAVLLMTKNDKIKSICSASGISALLGITEPAMFGVTLKLKYPFYAAMAGSAVGSAYLAATKTLAQALGAAGLPGFISMKPDHYMNFAIGIILSMGVSFALTIVFWKKVGLEKQDSTKAAPVSGLPAPETPDTQTAVLYAPMKGEMIPVERSEDEVFASKALGDGVAINPEDGMVYAPCDGTVTLLFPTRHAVGIRTESGVEVLIHIGINTVQLDGQGFEAYVAQGDTVKQGDPLILADLDLIREKGLNPQTMMILPEGAGLRIRRSADSQVDKDTRAVAVYK
ncbi:PTS beta-glucoside transporter subunit IIBCA, partial [Enterocloster citroniae]|uniref:PTS beta-glucoside transporter subunit IIBCA n=1 Tax=Enterocloster citroniae TaxID=358743 RepID=UPI00305D6019|nr:glucose PTS transporter subunit IIA [Enterocloster citroniae]